MSFPNKKGTIGSVDGVGGSTIGLDVIMGWDNNL